MRERRASELMRAFDICDFTLIQAAFVKDIVAVPLAQKPVYSKQAIN